MTVPVCPNVSTPGKQQIVFLPEDDAAYFDLLIETFPNIRFINQSYSLPKGERPPSKTVRTLAECLPSSEDVTIVFDPSWSPIEEWTTESTEQEDDCLWELTGPTPYPNGEYERSSGVQSFGHVPASEAESAECIFDNRLYFRYLAGNEADARTVRKALRLFSKIASNRNLMVVNPYTGKVVVPDARHGPWIGHHARRWCLEKPGRFLAGSEGDWNPRAFLPWPADAKAPPAEEGRPWPTGGFPRPPAIEMIVRQVVLSPEDEIAYATLLRETMPDIRFLDLDFVEGYKERSAGTGLLPDSCPQVAIVFDPSWTPGLSCPENTSPDARRLRKICFPFGILRRRYGIWNRTDFRNISAPPLSRYISPSNLVFRYIADDKKQQRMVRVALRLLGKIADNRHLIRIHPLTRKTLDENALDGPWVGHHARRWCLEQPDRDFSRGNFDPAFRPKPGIRRPRVPR